MAQYFWTADPNDDGATPSNLTLGEPWVPLEVDSPPTVRTPVSSGIYEDTILASGRPGGLQFRSTTDARRVLSFLSIDGEAIPDTGDMELYLEHTFWSQDNSGPVLRAGPGAGGSLNSNGMSIPYAGGASRDNSYRVVRYIDNAATVLDTIAKLFPTSGFQILKHVSQVSGTTFRYKSWLSFNTAAPGISESEPNAWLWSGTETITTGYPGIHKGRGGTGYTNIYVLAIGIGTNGDVAPRERISEPFLLRHNPRLNKVIPVLTFPTVTDIGATCVRPRVTKGY